MHEKRMKVHRIRTPLSEKIARTFRVNDIVYLTGTIVTARDAAHIRALKYYKEGKALPLSLDGLAVFHCGPIVKKEDNGWRVVAAGPTTSARIEPFEDEFIKNFRVRIVIGKGGMGKKTVAAMKQFGAAYAAFTGGAAVLAAKAVKKVEGVEWSDLGMPEAMWILQVEDFGPLTIAIDAHGNNLYETIQTKADSLKQEIFRKLSKQ
jgi:fumarate hydratase subunit beta